MKNSSAVEQPRERTPIFDLAVELSATDPRDLRNLGYFGTRSVAGVWHPKPALVGNKPLIEQLRAGLAQGRRRLKEAGLSGGLWIGVDPEGPLQTGLSRALASLPSLLSEPQTLGVGPLGLRLGDAASERLLRAQLGIAKELRRPALYRLGTVAEQGIGGQREELAGLVRCLESMDFPPSQLCVLHAGPHAIVTLQALGILASLDALDGDAALEHLKRQGPKGLVLGSGLGFGQSDPLKTRRLLWQAMDAGVSSRVRWTLAHGSARQFVGV